MFKIEIELPESHGFIRAEQTFTVDMTKLSASIIAQLVMHGVTQKVGDAAAGKSGADALSAMTGVADALYQGDWGRQRGNAAEPAVNGFIREVVRKSLSDASKAEYKALDAKDRPDWLWAKFEALDAKVAKKVTGLAEASMEQARKEREEARAMKGELSL